MRSALLQQDTLDLAVPLDSKQPGAAAGSDALRLAVAERLAAHRTRRARQTPLPSATDAPPLLASDSNAARIAATVAGRYAQAQSYRAFLAAEAERAIQQAHSAARAAADAAAVNARAVALAVDHAQQQVLALLEQQSRDEALRQTTPAEPLPLWVEPPPSPAPAPALHARQPRPRTPHPTPASQTAAAAPAPGLTVHFFESSLAAARPAPPARPQPSARASRPEDALEAQALEAEIAFRQAPVFEEPAGPPMPLPANLIEFPRQLIAPRKARPRYAEGPLRDEEERTPGTAQLRIFEVETASISTTPDAATVFAQPGAHALDDTTAPQWTSLWLDTPATAPASAAHTSSPLDAPFAPPIPAPQPAALGRRLRAAAIDAGFVALGFLTATAAAASAAAHLAHTSLSSALEPAAVRSAVLSQPVATATVTGLSLALLWVLYQGLFFTFADATPGMRLSRIGLCTLADENPTRRAMRRRVFAVVLTACPLGLLWIALDNDRLAWHDRLSRMYQRSY